MLTTALHSLSVVAISASAHRLLRAMSIWTPEGILHGTPNPCESSTVALRLAFYNISWDLKNKVRGFPELSAEVRALVACHNVHVLSLCGVFGIDDGQNLEQKVGEQLMNALNQSKEWGGTWEYKACYHYVTLWRTDLKFRCVEERGFHIRIPHAPGKTDITCGSCMMSGRSPSTS